MARFRVGVQLHPQVATVDELRAAWRAPRRARGRQHLDLRHFFPLYGDPDANHYEASHAPRGDGHRTRTRSSAALVTCHSYQRAIPPLLADMARTIGTSARRLVLGYRIRLVRASTRSTATSSVRRLTTTRSRDRAADHRGPARPPGARPTATYRSSWGSGEKVMLRLVAEHGDAWNSFGPPEHYAEERSAERWCAEVGVDRRRSSGTAALNPARSATGRRTRCRPRST